MSLPVIYSDRATLTDRLPLSIESPLSVRLRLALVRMKALPVDISSALPNQSMLPKEKIFSSAFFTASTLSLSNRVVPLTISCRLLPEGAELLTSSRLFRSTRALPITFRPILPSVTTISLLSLTVRLPLTCAYKSPLFTVRWLFSSTVALTNTLNWAIPVSSSIALRMTRSERSTCRNRVMLFRVILLSTTVKSLRVWIMT